MIAAVRQRLHDRFVRWALRIRPPEPSPVVLTQRRVYVLPTRAGLAYAGSLGVILLGAMNYNLSLGHGLVFLLAGLGVIAILHTFRNLAHLRLSPGRCEPVYAGQPARFELVLDNPRRDARTSVRLGLPGQEAIETDVPAEGRTVAVLPAPTSRRGWLPLPRVTVETTWPLGLIRAWGYAVPDMRCLVYPAPAAKAPPLPWGGFAGSGITRDGRGRDDFAGLRNHQPADPPRHVAWKAAARQPEGPLLTKQFAGAAARRLWLDWEHLPASLDAEQRLAILARWMLDAEAGGLFWGLRLPAATLEPDHGARHLAQGLRALALFGDG